MIKKVDRTLFSFMLKLIRKNILINFEILVAACSRTEHVAVSLFFNKPRDTTLLSRYL